MTINKNLSKSDFIIYQSKHILIERDFIRKSAGGQRKWISFGIHFDWQKPHFIIYFANVIITIGNIIWGDSNAKHKFTNVDDKNE